MIFLSRPYLARLLSRRSRRFIWRSNRQEDHLEGQSQANEYKLRIMLVAYSGFFFTVMRVAYSDHILYANMRPFIAFCQTRTRSCEHCLFRFQRGLAESRVPCTDDSKFKSSGSTQRTSTQKKLFTRSQIAPRPPPIKMMRHCFDPKPMKPQ